MLTLLLLCAGAVNVLAEDYLETPLTADMFKQWDGDGATAQPTAAATVDFNIGNDATIGAGGMVCGTGSVLYKTYADMTGQKKLLIEGTSGMQLRVLMNRQGSDSGPLVEKQVTIDGEGKAIVDLSDLEFVHINSIKAGWGSAAGKITSIKGLVEVDITPITNQFKNWDGDGASANPTGDATVDFNIGNDATIGAGGMVCGTGGVLYLTYQDLTGALRLIIEGTSGMQLRVLMNRQGSNSGPLVEKQVTIDSEGKAVVDLSDLEFVHINAIKAGWGSASGKISAIKTVKLADIKTPITADMFKNWDGDGASANPTSDATVDFNIGNDATIGAGGMVCGTGGVLYLTYADMSGATKMKIEGTPGMQLRILMNRQGSNSGPLVEKQVTIDAEGKAEVDLSELNFVHINAIKAGWGSASGKISSIIFLTPPDPLAQIKKKLQSEINNAKELNTAVYNSGYAQIITDIEAALADPAATKESLEAAKEKLTAATDLKTAIDKANATNPAAYNEESFTNMLNAAATADGELADPAATKASLEAALTALQKVVNALVLKNGYSDLTKADYNDGTCDYNLNTDTDMVYGQSGVDKGKYANLIDYDKLIVTVTSGAPRFCFNRETADGADAENEADSKMIDIPGFAWGSLRYLTVSDDKTVWTIDIQKMGVEKGKVLLHAIKGADGNKVTVTGIYKVNTSNIDVQQQSIGRLKGSDLYPDAGELNAPLTNEDNMALIPTKESKQDIRLWEQADGKVELQIKKGNTFFIQTASEGKAVYRIKFVGNNVKLVCSNGAIEESEKPDYKTVIWNGEIDAVKFWALEDMTLTLVRVYSRPSTTETPIYEPNDDEVAKNVQAALKEALKEAEAVDVKTKTDETVEVFKEALSNARMQDEMKTSIVDVEGARLALKDAIKGLKDKPASGEIIVDLDGAIYHHWSAVSGTAEDQGSANGGVKLNEAVGAGGALWGNLSGAVPYLDYANITDYDELRFEGTPGAQLRLMTNRLVDEGPIFEKIYTIGEDGKLTVPVSELKYLNGGADADFVCLQAIKVPWGGSEITLTSAQLVKIVPVDIVEDFDGSFYHNWSAVSGTAEDKGSANGGVKLNEAVGAGGALWGNLSGAVPYLDYANITDYDELRFEGTPGAQLRLMTNRLVDEGPIFEKIYTIGEDGKLTVPVSELKYLNGGADADFVCLQAIKVPWGGSEVTLTAIQIVKKSGAQPTPDEPQYKNDLTKDLFKKWSSIDADATSENTGCDLVLNSEVGPGSMVYGNASVSYLTYANLKGYKQIIINGDAGVQLRVLLNRLEVGNGGGDDNGGALTEVNVTIGEDGKAVVDLTAEELGGNARLNAIKTGWSSETGKIYGFELVKDEIVAVQAVKTEAEEEVIYDLRGQRLTKAVKGINIINGKKVFIK